MPPQEKILVPLLRDPSEVATHVRSTLLLSSIQSVRTRGLGERYLAALEPKMRETLMSSVAGLWMPMDVGVAHYQACDSLGLSLAEQMAIGEQVSHRIQGSVLGFLVRTAKNAGTTPWTVLEHIGYLWERVFQGGAGACLTQLGPKEARVDLIGLPLLAIPYFRHAYRGAFMAALELFCSKAYVNEAPLALGPNAASYRLSWA